MESLKHIESSKTSKSSTQLNSLFYFLYLYLSQETYELTNRKFSKAPNRFATEGGRGLVGSEGYREVGMSLAEGTRGTSFIGHELGTRWKAQL